MKFAEVKEQILNGERKRVCLVSEENAMFRMEKRKIYFAVANEEKVAWTAMKEVHEEKPVDNTDMLFVSNVKTMKTGFMTTEQFKSITAEQFLEVIKEAEEEVISADCGEYD